MIKLKNQELNDGTLQALNGFMEYGLKAHAAFRIARLIKQIGPIMETKADAEKKLLEKYAKRDEDGKYEPVIDDNGEVTEGVVRLTDPEAFRKEMEELQAVESELDYEPIDIVELGDVMIKPREIMLLGFLFK